MELLDIELIKGLLSDAARSSLMEKLFVWAIVWYMAQKTIAKHFLKIEETLKSVAVNLNELKESLVRVESSHSDRLFKVEERINKLETKE